MDYCNSKTYELRYSDFDFKDELKLSSLLALAQESACVSADELGFGYQALKALGYGFLVVNTYGELYRPIVLGDKLTVETWPLPPRHVICERDYRVKDGRGQTVAALASRWCLVDLSNFRLLTPDVLGKTHTDCPYRAEKTVEVPNWKIPKLTEAQEVYRMGARHSYCDHYLHVNNTLYADIFLDCFGADELKRSVQSFQIAYGKQVKEGEELVLLRRDFNDCTVCEAHSGQEISAQFRIRFCDNKA